MQSVKKNKTRIHFVVPYALGMAPGQRYRFEQYLKYLKEYYEVSVHSFYDAKTYDVLYKQKFISKLLGVIRGYTRKAFYLFNVHSADIIFIFRETNPFGGAFYEQLLKSIWKGLLIYDFDDSIWLKDKNAANSYLAFLKRPGKTKSIVRLADLVVVGNTYLANYASKFNNKVRVIPTTIDTEWYKPKEKALDSPVIIGWSGSFSTIKHFETIVPVLIKIKNTYKEKVRFKVIGDASYTNKELSIQGIRWQSETEVQDLITIDIGIMPLPDNDWTRGKCGAKGLQYMGLAIPTIMSPVGVNTEIINDGINGFLAETSDEWIDKLSQLIESPELRMKLGTAGRETVVEHYSVEANKEKFLNLFSN